MAGYVLHLSTEENITLSSATVKRLIAGGSGDAALLYLAILHARGAVHAGEIGFIYKKKSRHMVPAQQPPERDGVTLDARRAADNEHGAVEHLQRPLHLGRKVYVSRCI